MNLKVFTLEQWAEICEIMDVLTGLERVAYKNPSEPHIYKSVQETRTALISFLDRALSEGEWRDISDPSEDSDLPF